MKKKECCAKCLKCPDYSDHKYCHDKICECHTPHQPEKQPWKERFDERDVDDDFFTIDGNGFNDWRLYDVDKIKDFISQLLQEEREGAESKLGKFKPYLLITNKYGTGMLWYEDIGQVPPERLHDFFAEIDLDIKKKEACLCKDKGVIELIEEAVKEERARIREQIQNEGVENDSTWGKGYNAGLFTALRIVKVINKEEISKNPLDQNKWIKWM